MATCTGLTQLQTRWHPSTEKGKWTCAPLPNQEAISSWQPPAKEKLIFSSGVSAYKKAGPRPSRGRPTQNELGANFGGVLSHTALSRHCFTFLISWLYIIVSRFYFYVLCVYTCMCVCVILMFFLCFFFPLFISLLCSILTFLFVYFLIGLCVF